MAGWQQVLAEHPHGEDSARPEFWEAFLAERPEVLHRLLADVYQATYGTERPPTLDELWDLVATPEFSVKPFGEALQDLLAGRSVRWLAMQIGLHPSLLQRYISGERDVVGERRPPAESMHRLELIAKVLRTHPSYFSEWRRLWLMSLFDAAFATQPSLSVAVWKRFSGFAEGQNGRINGRSRAGGRR